METPLAKTLISRSMTATQLAALVGCDKGHLSNILNAKILERPAKPATRAARGKPAKLAVPAKRVLSRAGLMLARDIVRELGGAITVHQVAFPEEYVPEVAAALIEAEAWNKEQLGAREEVAA